MRDLPPDTKRGPMSLRTRTLAIGAVAALAMTGVTATAAASTGAPGWATTGTQSLSTLLTHATDLGALNPSKSMRIDVGLPVRHGAELASLARHESTPGSIGFGGSLSPAQFVSRFGPSTTSIDAVTTYLHTEGFTNVSIDANHLMITATGTVADVESAFNTKLDTFLLGGTAIFANVVGASVPSALAGDVSAVLGLNDLPMNAVSPQVATPKTPLTGYYPKEFQTVYGATGTPTGSKTNIAVFAEGNVSQVILDLRTAEKAQGLPQVPVIIVPTGPSTSDTAGVAEWDLDTQVSTGMAETVKRVYIYDEATMTDFDLAHSINVWASQDSAQLGSASIGEPDVLAWLDGAMISIDTAVEEGAAQGQSFFASTGDTGASCAVEDTNGVPDTGVTAALCYPSDGTWSTAVGGTTLITDTSDNYTDELAWNAGGGGVSYFEYPGSWSDTANPASAGGFRGSPDIAMDADLTTGANIYVDGTAETIGGTSVASPLAMGALARVDSALGGALGTAVLRFYALYNAANPAAGDLNATPGFHDVIAGTNGLYSAAPGWDYTTGIGSIDVAPLIKALATVPGAPTISKVTAGSQELRVAWAAPSSDGGSAITGYVATAKSGATTFTCKTSARSCKIYGLTNGRTYKVSVVADNAVGSSASSTTKTAKPRG
jgi:pseudomonalisin